MSKIVTLPRTSTMPSALSRANARESVSGTVPSAIASSFFFMPRLDLRPSGSGGPSGVRAGRCSERGARARRAPAYCTTLVKFTTRPARSAMRSARPGARSPIKSNSASGGGRRSSLTSPPRCWRGSARRRKRRPRRAARRTPRSRASPVSVRAQVEHAGLARDDDAELLGGVALRASWAARHIAYGGAPCQPRTASSEAVRHSRQVRRRRNVGPVSSEGPCAPCRSDPAGSEPTAGRSSVGIAAFPNSCHF